MMVGKSIRKCILATVVPMVVFFASCKEEQCALDIYSTTHGYIDYFKSNYDLREINYLVKVTIDSSNQDYLGYRINAFSSLMEKEDDVPSDFDIYSEFRITFHFKKLGKSEKFKMKRNLVENGFYTFDNLLIDSNYPEWVVLENKETKCLRLIKDASYMTLDELISSSKVPKSK
ncbi:hypothetical protein [Ulvibacterium marinum]|uniref:Lipoprotein n=1 Tax=Ulvibacterium marinum TaxID=2419782 RepID=A0A3B0BRH1_9FLAO|nr:hypothetical protein [Ulvibacterium marinum]RKN75915.1 hypothetical protein D7Z94_24960 [Ulvibacterium marinum]